MRIRIVEGEQTIVAEFVDIDEPGIEFEVIGSRYSRRVERDVALEAIEKILGSR